MTGSVSVQWLFTIEQIYWVAPPKTTNLAHEPELNFAYAEHFWFAHDEAVVLKPWVHAEVILEQLSVDPFVALKTQTLSVPLALQAILVM